MLINYRAYKKVKDNGVYQIILYYYSKIQNLVPLTYDLEVLDHPDIKITKFEHLL